jgi:hypothetical protein
MTAHYTHGNPASLHKAFLPKEFEGSVIVKHIVKLIKALGKVDLIYYDPCNGMIRTRPQNILNFGPLAIIISDMHTWTQRSGQHLRLY